MSNIETLTHQDTTGKTQTTVRIPDELLLEAKMVCLSLKNTSVNDLFLSGLRRELDARAAAQIEKRVLAPAVSGSSKADAAGGRQSSGTTSKGK